MRTYLAKPALLAAFALALSLTLSCSGDGGGTSTIKKAKISGISQKGPFTKGTRATLYELNGNFAQTGRSFFDIIADDKGSFEIKDVELASPYALLEADGFYKNEVTGQISAAPIKLYAIADVREKDNININLLTHLEYYRVLALADNGMSVAEAKKQAQKEILAVFGIDGSGFTSSEDMSIFGTSEGDAALLAISVLLQGKLGEGEFSQRLTDFAMSLKASGAWNNETEKTKMVEWASGANFESIKNAILGWELSAEVPEFGKYVYSYLVYVLGKCNTSNEYEIKNGWACKNGIWQGARYIDGFCYEKQICSTISDGRDGKAYRTVRIGEQTWMAENLDYVAEGSKCYENNPINCDIYGRLYNWDAAMNACPSGWHLPTNEEWTVLSNYVRSVSNDGILNLMATSGWNYHNGTDEFGFAALPGGDGDPTNGAGVAGYSACWWNATETTDDNAYISFINVGMSMVNYSIEGTVYNSKNGVDLHSVRCLKD